MRERERESVTVKGGFMYIYITYNERQWFDGGPRRSLNFLRYLCRTNGDNRTKSSFRETERVESKRADLKQLQRDLLRCISVATTYAAARERVNANTPFVLLLHHHPLTRPAAASLSGAHTKSDPISFPISRSTDYNMQETER